MALLAIATVFQSAWAIGSCGRSGCCHWIRLRLAKASRSFAQKALLSLEITVCRKVEHDRVAIVVDGAIRLKPRAFDLYISLVEVPISHNLAFPDQSGQTAWG